MWEFIKDWHGWNADDFSVWELVVFILVVGGPILWKWLDHRP